MIEIAKQAPEQLPNQLSKEGPVKGNPPNINIEKTDFKEKKNCTYFSDTRSKTEDFPTQDIFYPSPEMNLSINISIAFFVSDSNK